MNPARAINSATIAFGLVSIPCKVYSTSESTEEIKFNLLTKAGNRVEQVYRDKVTQELVPREELLKGYEHAKDAFVTFTQDEIDALDAVATNRIELEVYVPAEEVDGLYLEKHYYLGPDKGADRGYALLAAALNDTGLVGIGRWSSRGNEHVVAIRPYQDGLMIHQLRYERAIKAWDAVPERQHVEVTAAELGIAKQIIRAHAAPELDMSKYTDRVHDRIKELVETKAASGVAITVGAQPDQAAPSNVIDIMDQLRASLDAAPKKAPNAPTPKASKPTPIKNAKKQAKKPAAKKRGKAA